MFAFESCRTAALLILTAAAFASADPAAHAAWSKPGRCAFSADSQPYVEVNASNRVRTQKVPCYMALYTVNMWLEGAGGERWDGTDKRTFVMHGDGSGWTADWACRASRSAGWMTVRCRVTQRSPGAGGSMRFRAKLR